MQALKLSYDTKEEIARIKTILIGTDNLGGDWEGVELTDEHVYKLADALSQNRLLASEFMALVTQCAIAHEANIKDNHQEPYVKATAVLRGGN